MAPGLEIMGVIYFMKTIILFLALVIATNHSLAFNGPDPSDSATTVLSNGNVLGDNIISTGMSITLTNFKGVFTESMVVDLSWATMMESGVNYFAIQRSSDGINFQDIDSIESKMKISTHDYQLIYNYQDAHPLTGTSYYRIKVVAKNGYNNQSSIVLIKNTLEEGTKIYPTLVQNNQVFVETDKNLRSVKMEFFDISGKKISETNWASLNGRQNTQISKSGILPSGTYVARLTSNGQNLKTQMVIVQSH
jgi:hypothetical protein